jgi:hypothetical protein
MQANLSLEDLTRSVLRELDKFGLSSVTKGSYRSAFHSFKAFAAARDMDSFSESLAAEFLENIEVKCKTGAICNSRRDLLRRASLLLRDYVANKTIKWKLYVFKHQPMPASQEFLLLYSSFV